MKFRFWLPRWLRREQEARHHLYLSFTGILRDYLDWYRPSNPRREVSLRNAIFYFGATREHVMNPVAADATIKKVARERPFKSNPAQSEGAYTHLYGLVCGELLVAESEGRVLWREVGKERYNQDLSDFLVRNSYPPLPPLLLGDLFDSSEIKRWIEREKIPLAVHS